MGSAVFADIENRWNKGRFGLEWDEADARHRHDWDTHLGEGRSKIFDVRRTYMDWFFIDEFLTREMAENLGLYLFVENDKDSHYETVVEETDWARVKRMLVQSMMNWGIPRILLTDGNYQGSLQLYLSHAYEGLPAGRGVLPQDPGAHLLSLGEARVPGDPMSRTAPPPAPSCTSWTAAASRRRLARRTD